MAELRWRGREEVNDGLVEALAEAGLNDRVIREAVHRAADDIYDDDWCGKHRLENRKEAGRRAVFSPASQALLVREMIYELGKTGVRDSEKKKWAGSARALLGVSEVVI